MSRMTKNKKTYVLIVSERFPAHHIKKGEPTKFISNILNNIKIHTLRHNIELWRKRCEEVNQGKAVISLRIWSGKPYNSKQIEILRITKIGFQTVSFDARGAWIEDKKFVYLDDLTKNDGLSTTDFMSWFKGLPKTKMAIIHFTNFRY